MLPDSGDRTLPWQYMALGEKYLAVFNDGDHAVFSGQQNSGPRQRRNQPNSRNSAVENQVNAVSLAFWDSTLKQNPAAKKWLVEEASGWLGSEAKLKVR